MKKIIVTFILIICTYTAKPQRYTETYIKDANKVALNWLNNINNNRFSKGFEILDKEIKNRTDSVDWCLQVKELMTDFGRLNERIVISKEFTSQLEGLPDGFYVKVEYSSNYENTYDHTEVVLLRQSDQLEWKIIDFNYEYKNK